MSAQDTLSVYFDFGIAKVKPQYHAELEGLAVSHDLANIDSVQFIGYADSVGNWKANVRLSEKRAKNVYKLCKRAFEKEMQFSILAKGEGQLSDDASNRRVDIIIHYPKEIEPESDVIIEESDPMCFFVDFVALQSCNVREVKKKRKDMVYIEALPNADFIKEKHYFVKKDLKGNVTVQQIKWKKKTTGKLWWKKSRLVTTIPKSSFEKFQFFTMKEPPCDGCKEDIFTEDTIIMNVRKWYPDGFLMSNMQTKVRFFGKGELKVRAPREYVDRSDSYYIGKKPYYGGSNSKIEWKEKRGKRKQAYYYTRIPLIDSRMPYIKKSQMTTVCVNKYEGGDTDKWIGCGGFFGKPVFGMQFNIEPGAFYRVDTLTAYVTIGGSHTTDNLYTALKGGINSHLGFYGFGRFQYHFMSFPFQALNPGNAWGAPTRNLITTYGRLYAGMEAQTSFNKSYQSFFEGNLHLGLCVVNTKEGGYLPRIYVQGGISKDMLNRISDEFYPFLQIGATFRIKI